MIGKLAGAWLGSRIAGRHSGAKGAILGYGAAALARRGVPALAAVALGGWAFKRWRERVARTRLILRRRRRPSGIGYAVAVLRRIPTQFLFPGEGRAQAGGSPSTNLLLQPFGSWAPAYAGEPASGLSLSGGGFSK